MSEEKKSKWSKAKELVVTVCAVVGAMGAAWTVYDHVSGDRESASATCKLRLDDSAGLGFEVTVVNQGRRTIYVQDVWVFWTPKGAESEWLPYHGGIPPKLTAIEPGASKTFDITGLDRQYAEGIANAGYAVELIIKSPKGELVHERAAVEPPILNALARASESLQRQLAQTARPALPVNVGNAAK